MSINNDKIYLLCEHGNNVHTHYMLQIDPNDQYLKKQIHITNITNSYIVTMKSK